MTVGKDCPMDSGDALQPAQTDESPQTTGPVREGQPDLRSHALKTALIAFAIFRLVTAVWATFIILRFPLSESRLAQAAEFLSDYDQHVAAYSKPVQALIGPWYRWDAVNYVRMSQYGYQASDFSAVWPPLYPLLIAGVDLIVGQPLVSSLIVSSLALLAALYLYYLYVAEIYPSMTVWAVIFWLAWPSGFFLVAGYTESVWVVCALGALLLARRGRWFGAGVCAALATLTRSPGIVLGVPLAYAFWEQHRGQPWKAWLKAGWLALIPLVYGAYALYVYRVTGSNVWEPYSGYWHTRYAWPWEGIIGNITVFFDTLAVQGSNPRLFALILDVVTYLMMLELMVVATRRRFPRLDIVHGWAFMLFYVTIVYVPGPHLVATSRYLLTIFPGFAVLPMIVRKPHTRILTAALFGLIQLAALGFHVWHFWVA
jgi:hypothetical protein